MRNAAGAAAPLPAQLRYRLAELILADSARAGLGPGSRLPTERKLAADMGATRTSIRQALAVLEAEGHISREVGRGTFLRRIPGPAGAGTGALGDGAAGRPAAGDGATGRLRATGPPATGLLRRRADGRLATRTWRTGSRPRM